MSEEEKVQLQHALEQAKQAIRQGDHPSARRWAIKAAQLAPRLEDPWLILAAVASPEASIAYLRHALEVNPTSQRARQGMQWAYNRRLAIAMHAQAAREASLAKTQQIETIRAPSALKDTQPIFSHERSTGREKPRRKYSFVSWLIALVVFSLGIIFWIGFSNRWVVSASSNSAFRPVGALSKPSLTFSPTITSTHTPTSTSTPTPTATPTFTPTRTRKPTRTPTYVPTETPLPPPTYDEPSEVPLEPTDSLPDGVSYSGRWIDVDLTNQIVSTYSDSTIVNSFIVSTGTWEHPTITGQYHIYVKYRYTDMSGPGYYLSDVPYTMYFYQGYALHGTYWHNNFGTPMSHGCINLRTEDAAWLYNWASVGTLVNIHY